VDDWRTAKDKEGQGSIMNVLYLECFAGISGNMLTGAFLDAGMPMDHLKAELAKLPLAGEYELVCRPVTKLGISATYFDVVLTGHEASTVPTEIPAAAQPGPAEVHSHAHEDKHEHKHEDEHKQVHSHVYGQEQDHDHSHTHGHAHGDVPEKAAPAPHSHGAHRGLREIRQILNDSTLSPFVKAKAEAIFVKLAGAEAKVHQCDVETVHFHEVGAVDAIIDIVAAAVGLEYFQIEKIWSTPVNTGKGMVFCAHGWMPIPAPATARLLQGVPIFHREDIEKELTTPTGAAILAEMAPDFHKPPVLIAKSIGYGAGTMDLPIPNTLRITIAEAVEDAVALSPLCGIRTEGRGLYAAPAQSPRPWSRDRVLQVETAIDDMQPEWYALLLDRLFAAGALDAYLTPIQMKKNRPGQQLTCLMPPEKKDEMLQIIFENTTALGLRLSYLDRAILKRSWKTIETPWGPVRIKLGLAGDKVINQAPEYEDCAALARTHDLPVKTVYIAALAAGAAAMDMENRQPEGEE